MPSLGILSDDFNQLAIATFRAWDAFEQRSGGEIIDVDVAPPSAETQIFNSQSDVLRALAGLQEHPQLKDQAPIVKLRLDASLMYLDVAKYEAEVEFNDYAETLMGVKPKMVDEDEIARDIEQLRDFLALYGATYDFNDRYQFDAQFGKLETTEQIEACLEKRREISARYVARLAAAKAVNISTGIKSEDAAWIARFKMVNGEPFYWVNVHPRHSHTKSRISANSAHETGHAQHFGLIAAGIKNGELDAFLGITTEHGPECTHEEAMAQLSEQIVLGQSADWRDKAEAMYKALRTKVIHNNAHIMINSGIEMASVIKYVKERIPFEPEENIKKSMEARRDNPKLRAYYYCYQPALRIIKPLITMDSSRRAPVLQRLYRSSLSPTEIAELVKTV